MSILVEFSVVPIGQGTSISPLIAKALKVVIEGGCRIRPIRWALFSRENGRR